MSLLENIGKKNLVEQIAVFEQIEKEKNQNILQELFSLYTNPDSSEETLFLGQDALKALLLNDIKKTAEGLGSGCEFLKNVCLEILKTTNSPEAVPALITVIDSIATDSEKLKTLAILSRIKSDETIKYFRTYTDHADSLISSLAIETLGNFKDDASIDKLICLVDSFLSKQISDTCDMSVANAIVALGKIGGEKVLNYLITLIHHQNPIVRKFVHEALGYTGLSAIPYLREKLKSDNIDEKIMAADVLGNIKDKKCVDVLLEALDTQKSLHTNVRCAIYNAIGFIPSMKSAVCLTDALQETDTFALTAVVSSLGAMVSPAIMDKIILNMKTDEKHGRDIARAVILSQSTELFKLLLSDQKISDLLINSIIDIQDKEITNVFLPFVDADRKRTLLEEIEKNSKSSLTKSKIILAVDDSKSILAFYRGVVAELGYTIKTAGDGRQGITALNEDPASVNMILVDMNMPVMNGIEFTQKVREDSTLSNIPIVMATTESEESQKELARKAGVNDFLTKPFTQEILTEKIRKFVEHTK